MVIDVCCADDQNEIIRTVMISDDFDNVYNHIKDNDILITIIMLTKWN